MFVLLLLSSFLVLVSADVYCNSLVPPYLVPSLESCDAAILTLEQADAQCGTGNIIFGPTATGSRSFHLPALFMGSKPQHPVSDLICVIYILWQPKLGVLPPIASIDIFAFRKILLAANMIRDQCIKGNQHFLPRAGRAWIEPHQWVDVQFGSVFGPRGRGLAVNNSDVESGNLTVMLADGSNQTIVPSMLGQIGYCGAATGFENGLGTNNMETS